MYYKDFLNAARKHRYTCEVLIEKFNSLDKNKEKSNCKYLLSNIYYLSGYIIECIVKYGIYSLIGYPNNKDIKELNQDGLTYKKVIESHKFKNYTEYFKSKYHGTKIPLINCEKNIDRKIIDIYNKWDSVIRYSYELEYKDNLNIYLKFNEYSNEIFEIITDNVKG